MTTDPRWHDKVMEALENAIELFSPGALTFALGDDGDALAVAPSLLELEEEEGDVFSHFHFDISNFAELFDEPPDIGWRTYPDSAISFGGRIDGQEASVEVFGQPLEDAQPIGVVDKDGNVREIPDAGAPAGELDKALAEQIEAFRDRFGRDPDPCDPLFFDPDGDTPTPLDQDQVMRELLAAGHQAGLPPALIHAIQETGMMVTDVNRHLLSDADLEEWRVAVERGEALHGSIKDPADPEDKAS